MDHPIVPPQAGDSFAFLGTTMRLLLTGADTGGQFALMDGIVPPGGDSRLHVHHREDESFAVLKGELEVTLDGRTIRLAAGDSCFCPRGVPHRMRNTGQVDARTTLVVTPAGFEDFVAATSLPLMPGMLAPPLPAPTPDQVAELMQLAQAHAITILEPPALPGMEAAA